MSSFAHEDSVEKVLQKSLLEIQLRMAQEIRIQLALGREKIMKKLSKTKEKFAAAFRIMDRQDKSIEEAFGKLEIISSRLDSSVREQKKMSKHVYSMERLARSRHLQRSPRQHKGFFPAGACRPEHRNLNESSFGNRPIQENASPASPTSDDQRIGDQMNGWTQRGHGIFTSDDSDSDDDGFE